MLATGAATAALAGRGSAGFTLIELLLAAADRRDLLSMSVPLTTTALDEIRTSMAARYLEGRIMNARMLAVKRSANVALRFEAVGGGYRVAEYLDGNGNGVRSAEIAAGIDTQLAPRQFLHEQFPGVVFGLRASIPDIDGARITADSDGDPHRLEPHSHAGTRRHRHVGHAVPARPARPVRGARARRHRPDAGAAIRYGDGAMD